MALLVVFASIFPLHSNDVPVTASMPKTREALTRSGSESPGVGGDLLFSGPLDMWNPTVQRLYQFLQRKQLIRLRGRGVRCSRARESPVRIDPGQS